MLRFFLIFNISVLSFYSKAQNKILILGWEGEYQEKCNPNYRAHAFHTDDEVHLKFFTTNHKISTPGDSLVTDIKFDKRSCFEKAKEKGANLKSEMIHYRIDFTPPTVKNDTFKFFFILEHSTKKIINSEGLYGIAFKEFRFDLNSGKFISKKRQKTKADVDYNEERLKLNQTIFQNVYCLNNSIPKDEDSLMIQNYYWNNGRLKEKRIFYNGVFDYYSKFYHPNGNIHFEFEENDGDQTIINAWDSIGNQIVNKGNGYFKSYYENGQLESEGWIKDNEKDSLWIYYYSKGQIKETGIYKKELNSFEKYGKWTSYFRSGKLKSEYFHKLEKTNFFHPNGKKALETDGTDFMNRKKNINAWDLNGKQTCKNGNGHVLNYFEDGTIESRIKIHNYLKDTVFYYHHNGTPMKVIKFFNDNNRPSIWIENSYLNAWDINGIQTLMNGTGWIKEYAKDSTQTLTHFKNGMLDGKKILYYQNEIKKQVDTFKENRWRYRVIYYDNGNKYYEFDSKNDPLSYSFNREWWYNGNLKREELANKTIEYHPNGQLKSFGYYPTDTSKNKYDKDYYLVVENFGYYGDEISYYPFQRRKTWFNNGVLRSEVNYDKTTQKLIRKEYYKNGKIRAQGEIKYGEYKFDPDKTIYESNGFVGYLKVGYWTFYNQDETIINKTNMDKELLSTRLIGYHDL